MKASVLVLGYVWSLDFSEAPLADLIKVQPHHTRGHHHDRLDLHMEPWGRSVAGQIVFSADGAKMENWFQPWAGVVAQAPEDFQASGANGGNPAVSWEKDDDESVVILTMADGLVAKVEVGVAMTRIIESSDDPTDEETVYLLRTASLLLAE